MVFSENGKDSLVPRLRFPEFRNSEEWKKKPLSDLIKTVTAPSKIQTRQYCIAGAFPIIDQSQDYVSGRTDDESAVIKSDLPLIVFGDHTCILKIIKEPFAQGADGIKIFSAASSVITLYLYQYLLFDAIKSKEYKRHFSILKEKKIAFPRKQKEQEKIANYLSSLDDLIAATRKKLELLEKHKKGLMQGLFSVLE